jgi:hypothetical protein
MGLIGLLREADASFEPVRARSYRASNRDGYLVDLIQPEAKDALRGRARRSLTDYSDDLRGVEILGLNWLLNSPRCDAVAIDDRGYPVRMAVIDPRAFALHKLWLSVRQDRERLKATRDIEQARVAAAIAVQYLQLPFDDKILGALPASLRELAPQLAPPPDASKQAGQPNW